MKDNDFLLDLLLKEKTLEAENYLVENNINYTESDDVISLSKRYRWTKSNIVKIKDDEEKNNLKKELESSIDNLEKKLEYQKNLTPAQRERQERIHLSTLKRRQMYQ